MRSASMRGGGGGKKTDCDSAVISGLVFPSVEDVLPEPQRPRKDKKDAGERKKSREHLTPPSAERALDVMLCHVHTQTLTRWRERGSIRRNIHR